MCGGICGPYGENDEGYGFDKICNICGKTLRMCSCLSTSKKVANKKKKKKRSIIEELAEG